MKISNEFYQLSFASSEEDLQAAQRLRYAVFVEEMGASISAEDGALKLERDAFDPFFDHLLLRDLRVDDPIDQVVGIYRIMTQEAAVRGIGFYSQNEYDLSPLMTSGRKILELGRSCLHPKHRKGSALHILWNGLADYITKNEVEILFGTASFPGVDVKPLADSLSHLHHSYLAPQALRVRVKAPQGIDMNILDKECVDRRRAIATLPALLKAYLRLGGFVGEGAWVDPEFNTTDVCLIVDVSKISLRQKSIYSSAEL